MQEVAIKMLYQSDPRAQQSFLHEISILKFASRDRNVVQFYGVSLQNGIWLITEHMEVTVLAVTNQAHLPAGPISLRPEFHFPPRPSSKFPWHKLAARKEGAPLLRGRAPGLKPSLSCGRAVTCETL